MIELRCVLFVVIACVLGCTDKRQVTEQVGEDQAIPAKTSIDENKYSMNDKKTILFYGNSLTAGYGLDESESFPSLIQDRLDSLGYDYEVINAGLSGETSSGGKNRIDWVMRNPVDIFVLELGANDLLRGLDIAETEKNLDAILATVKSKAPNAQLIVAGLIAPPNMGETYNQQFTSMFANLAAKYEAGLIPFLLDKVAGNPALNLEDGKHPNAIGQYIVRDNVWQILSTYLTK